MKTMTLNKKIRAWAFSFALCSLLFVLFSCDHGELGGADKTDTYYPEDALFKERMDFLCGKWSSSYDDYRIRKLSDFDAEDKARAQVLFPTLDVDNPKTYSTQEIPPNSYYIVLFDDNAGGESWGFGFMGLTTTQAVKAGALALWDWYAQSTFLTARKTGGRLSSNILKGPIRCGFPKRRD